MDLRGRVALVTGGGGAGIGRSVALRLARDGAAVVAADIDVTSGNETVTKIDEARGHGAFVRADITSEDDVREMVAFARQTFGADDSLAGRVLVWWTTTDAPKLMAAERRE